MDHFLANLDAVNPGVEHALVSARTGEGVDRVPGLARGGGRQGGRAGVTGALAADASAVRELLARRTEAGERFFGAEAERIARLCHGMAERFARGGRLLALGRLGPGALGRAPRGRGVRAPGDRGQAGAAGARARGGARLRRAPGGAARAARTTWRSPSGPRPPQRWRGARLAAASPLACEPLGAEWEFAPPAEDPFVHQELAETLYHLLWELCHVFFDHRGLLEGRDARAVHDTGASSFLYPFLGETRARPRGGGGGRARVGGDEGARGGRAARADARRGGGDAPARGPGAARAARARRQGARARQRRLGHRRDGRGGRPSVAAARAGRRAPRST